MEKEKGGFSPWRKCTQALLDLKWYLPQPLFFVKITTSETEILLKERSYYQQQSHFTAMWLTAGHMVPRSPLVDSSIILTREEERLSLPSSLPTLPLPFALSSFFPSPPSDVSYEAGTWSWPLRKTPLGPGDHLSSLNALPRSRLMRSAAAASQRSPPFTTKPVTLARERTISITVTLQSPASPVSQRLSLGWSIYSPSVCLKHTSHSRGKLISPSLPSLLSLSFSLPLPQRLQFAMNSFPFLI